jgi:hypothetical protein
MYDGIDNKVFNPSPENIDDGFLFVQRFYREMNKIANEVMFMPLMSLTFSFYPMRALEKTILSGGNVSSIGESRQKMESLMPNLRHHLEIIECERCIKINWLELWCKNDLCRAVDDNGIVLFLDIHHVSFYGSQFVGDYLRKLYDDYVKIKHG